MPLGPLRRARAERCRSLSSSVRTAVYSCFLHGFCTNGLGDTGFVLLVLCPGMVANGHPWVRHPPGGRGSPGDDALAFTSTIHAANTTTHHAADTHRTQALSVPARVQSTPRAVLVSVCAAARSLGRFLGVSDALTCTTTAKTPPVRSLQRFMGQEQQTHQKKRKMTKNQVNLMKR
jgi:hypothetical protein